MNELKILPIKDQQTAQYVLEQAAKNGHLLIQPTHYIQKNQELIGAFNLARLPVCNFWMHTERAQIRDSLIAMNVGENLLAAQNQEILTVLCTKDSPFRSLIERLGYKQMGTNFDVMYKFL